MIEPTQIRPEPQTFLKFYFPLHFWTSLMSTVLFHFPDQKLKLVFQKSNKLIDDNFVYIKRDGNSSRLVEDYHKIASKYDGCFYRNINSALDICEGNIVSIVSL